MIEIDKIETVEGLSVYGDDVHDDTFYVVADTPRFRLDDNGNPVFKFLKYRFPINRPDGKTGGGFVIMDVEFVAPEDKVQRIVAAKQDWLNKKYQARNVPPVNIGSITYTRGIADMHLLDSGGALVQKIQKAGKPSLFGKNITAFTAELSPEGATLLEQALQGKGGVVQAVYDLNFMTKLPPLTADVWFNASKFMSYVQTLDKSGWHFLWWGTTHRTERTNEIWGSSEWSGIHLDFKFAIQPPEQDAKLKSQIRDWATRTLEDAAKSKVLEAIPGVSDEQKKLPDDVDHFKRVINVSKFSSFSAHYREDTAIEWNIIPQGTLPNITNLKGRDGKPILWKDYAVVVDLNDAFFKQLNVTVQSSADFQKLPIHTIQVHLDYKSGKTHEIGEVILKGPNDVGKFSTYIENEEWKYKYWYQVNYKGESKNFRSAEAQTDERNLIINFDELGLLAVDIQPGTVNFDQVAQVELVLQYEDKPNGVNLIEQQFVLDKNRKEAHFQKLIFQPRRNPYRYRVKYLMTDGKEYHTDWTPLDASQLFVDTPFSEIRTISLRSIGDLEKDINTIYLDLKYVDDKNKYTQNKSIALNKGNPFFDWSIPVIDADLGRVTYSGNITFMDGTTEAIPQTVASGNTIMVGRKVAGFLEVQVIPDLVDFAQVKLVKVSLHYEDRQNGISESKDLIFRQGSASPPWRVQLKNKGLLEYRWQATFYMNDNSTRKTALTATTEPSIVLQVPSAAAAAATPGG